MCPVPLLMGGVTLNHWTSSGEGGDKLKGLPWLLLKFCDQEMFRYKINYLGYDQKSYQDRAASLGFVTEPR